MPFDRFGFWIPEDPTPLDFFNRFDRGGATPAPEPPRGDFVIGRGYEPPLPDPAPAPAPGPIARPRPMPFTPPARQPRPSPPAPCWETGTCSPGPDRPALGRPGLGLEYRGSPPPQLGAPPRPGPGLGLEYRGIAAAGMTSACPGPGPC